MYYFFNTSELKMIWSPWPKLFFWTSANRFPGIRMSAHVTFAEAGKDNLNCSLNLPFRSQIVSDGPGKKLKKILVKTVIGLGTFCRCETRQYTFLKNNANQIDNISIEKIGRILRIEAKSNRIQHHHRIATI